MCLMGSMLQVLLPVLQDEDMEIEEESVLGPVLGWPGRSSSRIEMNGRESGKTHMCSTN